MTIPYPLVVRIRIYARYLLIETPLLRFLVVVSVLLASASLAYSGSTNRILLVIVLIGTIGAVLLLLRLPALGLIFLVASTAISNNGPSNSNLTMAVAAGLIGLWLFEILIRRQPIEIHKSMPIAALAALVIGATLAFAVGQLPWYSYASHAPLGAQLGGLSLYYLSAGVFLVAAYRIKKIYWLKWIVWCFLVLGALAVFGYVMPNLAGTVGGILGLQALGSLFWMWLLTLTVSQVIFNTELNMAWRAALAALAVLVIYLMLTEFWDWNSGWTPAFFAVGSMMIIAQPKLSFVGALAGIAFAATKFDKILAMIMVGDNQYSYDTRLEAWAIVWEIAKVNPVLGLGPANYYWYTPLFPIRGYAVSFNSHQQYIDLIAQTGILGLVSFIWFFATIGWVAWRLRPRARSGFERAYVYAALGGTIGTFVSAGFGDWVIPFFYNITLGGFRASMLSWLFLGGLIALAQMIKEREGDATLHERNEQATRLTGNQAPAENLVA